MRKLLKAYYLRLISTTENRIFQDDFLMNLSYDIGNDFDLLKYIELLNEEFRGDIPEVFQNRIEELS